MELKVSTATTATKMKNTKHFYTYMRKNNSNNRFEMISYCVVDAKTFFERHFSYWRHHLQNGEDRSSGFCLLN